MNFEARVFYLLRNHVNFVSEYSWAFRNYEYNSNRALNLCSPSFIYPVGWVPRWCILSFWHNFRRLFNQFWSPSAKLQKKPHFAKLNLQALDYMLCPSLLNKKLILRRRRIHDSETLNYYLQVSEHKNKALLTSAMSAHKTDWNCSEKKSYLERCFIKKSLKRDFYWKNIFCPFISNRTHYAQ